MAKTHLRTDYQDGEELLAYDVNLITDTVNTLSDNDDTHEQEIEDINIEIEGIENDIDTIENKLDTIETGAQVNIIETVKVNGTALVPDQDRAVDVVIEDYTAGDNIDITNNEISAKGYHWNDTRGNSEGALNTKYFDISTGTLTDNTSTGKASLAEGMQTQATSIAAHAEGYMTIASGGYAHAEGGFSHATGNTSHAEGYNAESNGNGSHAEGLGTRANGSYQHVSGKYNVEDNNSKYSEIIGNGSGMNSRSNARTLDWNGNQWTSGDVLSGGTDSNPTHKLSDKVNASDAILGVKVNGTTVTPDANRVVDIVPPSPDGYVWDGTVGSLATQYLNNGVKTANTSTGNGSLAEGKGSSVSGQGSHAEGRATVFQADYAHAEGYSVAESPYSHAEGYFTAATGLGSHAEGYGVDSSEKTLAIGQGSHAEGYATKAEGVYSHTEGNHTWAQGQSSHAEGLGTNAGGHYQHVSGKYNVLDTTSTYAEIIGNGSNNNNRSNARTLDWNGNQWTAGDITSGGTVANPSHTLSLKANSSDVYTKAQVDATFCKVVTLTQAQYDALATKDPMTLYIISDAS